MITPGKLQVAPDNAARFAIWLQSRGGLLVWNSADLSDPGASVTTPALTVGGEPTASPGWKFPGPPARHVTSVDDVEVVIDRVVKRFHVAVRPSGNGLALKVTDAGSARIRREVEQAGPGAYHRFDYGQHENCVICAPAKVVPLVQFLAEKE